MAYIYDPETAQHERHIAEDIADAHAKGRTHYTEIPRQPRQMAQIDPDEWMRLRAIERRVRAQAELIRDLRINLADLKRELEPGSMAAVKVETMLRRINEPEESR